jgi:hypothetical protein
VRTNDLHIFEVPGCGRIISDLGRDDLPPIAQFEDGTHTFGLNRVHAEASIMGYENIAEANFIHEAIHVYLANKCRFTTDSILYRAGHGADFDNPDILRDAKNEERLVLGLQIDVNEIDGKVVGFLLHIAEAAREFARGELRDRFGLDMAEMKGEFLELMAASGCLKRVFERVPRLVLNNAPDWPSSRIHPESIFGDMGGIL